MQRLAVLQAVLQMDAGHGGPMVVHTLPEPLHPLRLDNADVQPGLMHE
jgi:hypothetical protein